MGPFGDRAGERFKETMHGLSNQMTVLHAAIYALKRHHAPNLSSEARDLIDEIDAACTKAIAHVHELHAQT